MTDEKDVELSAEVEANDAETSSPDEGAAAIDSSPADDEAVDQNVKVVNESDESEEDAEAAMLAMLEDLPQEESSASADDIDFGSAQVASAEFQQLSESVRASKDSNIDLLMDVDLPVSIELGRTKLSIAEILALGPGSVVELNKLAGEPVDLMVNSKVVARGEVVVVDENFGLRITQLLTPEERVKSLGKE